MFSVDRDWNYTYVNRAGGLLVGRDAAALVGTNMWEEFPEAVGTPFEHYYRMALESQQLVAFEEYFPPLGRWYSIRVFPSENGLTIYYTDTSETRRQVHELADLARRQSALAGLSRRCVTAASLAEMLQDVARTVVAAFDAVEVEILGRPSAHAEPVVVASAAADDPESATSAAPATGGEDRDPATLVHVPVPGAGTAATELVLQLPDRRVLGHEEGDFLTAVTALISSCARKIEGAREVRYQALHDPLTGLPNQRMLLTHLEEVLARSRKGSVQPAVLAASVDRLWLITGSYGHRVADELLVELAERIRRVTEPHVMLSRTAGDLFVLVIDEPEGELAPTRVAARLHAAMREALSVQSGEHFMALNIGIAQAEAGSQPAALLRDADAALKRTSGSRRTVVFDDGVRSEIVRQAALHRELHRAVERGELEVHYQPLVQLPSRRPIGVEALVRWNHPDQGLVAPGEFIAAAEDNGLIVPIGGWVLERACAQAAAWQRELDRALRVSVNVSARQLADPDFGGLAADLAAASGLRPGTLELEITESLLMESAEPVVGGLGELRELGIALALDDFGTGYSSLSYLTQLAVDTLKIDRSFIDGLQPGKQAAIVEAMIKMAHAAGITVVAEGVESVLQHDLLVELGCDRAQGYLYARPAPADELGQLLR